MGGEWPIVKLGEVAEITSSKRIKRADYVAEGVPFFRSKEIIERSKGNEISTELYISEEQFNAINSKFGSPSSGDILLTSVGTLGIPYQIQDQERFYFKDGNLTWFRFFEENVNPSYIYYWLTSPTAKQSFSEVTIGSTQQALTIAALKSISLKLPPLKYQNEIVCQIEAITQKLKLNRQTNETLEKMAQALFKSWFVDFDPVIDNALAAGNTIPDELQDRAARRQQQLAKPDHQPLPDDIRQLFPSEFELTEEVGWVPMGWEVKPLGASFELLGGHPFKSSSYLDDGNYGVVTIRNVQDGFFVQECANRTSDIPPKMKAHCGLSKGDVLISLTGNVGRVCIVSEGNYLLNQRVAKILGKDSIPKSVAYFFFRQASLYKQMITITKGTAQQNLSPIETIKIESVLPSNFILAKLSTPFEALFNKMTENTVQSQTLSKIRDTLLPKLISGELRLPPDAPADAEQQLADAIS